MEGGKQRHQDDVARPVTRPEPHRKCVGGNENQCGKEKMPRSVGIVQGHARGVEEVENRIRPSFGQFGADPNSRS